MASGDRGTEAVNSIGSYFLWCEEHVVIELCIYTLLYVFILYFSLGGSKMKSERGSLHPGSPRQLHHWTLASSKLSGVFMKTCAITPRRKFKKFLLNNPWTRWHRKYHHTPQSPAMGLFFCRGVLCTPKKKKKRQYVTRPPYTQRHVSAWLRKQAQKPEAQQSKRAIHCSWKREKNQCFLKRERCPLFCSWPSAVNTWNVTYTFTDKNSVRAPSGWRGENLWRSRSSNWALYLCNNHQIKANVFSLCPAYVPRKAKGRCQVISSEDPKGKQMIPESARWLCSDSNHLISFGWSKACESGLCAALGACQIILPWNEWPLNAWEGILASANAQKNATVVYHVHQ